MNSIGYGTSGDTHDFNCFDDSGDVWNGSAFVTWVDADFADYRVAASELGTSGAFSAAMPTGTYAWVLRYQGADLDGSYPADAGVITPEPDLSTIESDLDALTDIVALVKAKTDLIEAGASVTVNPGVTAGGEMTIVRGDTFLEVVASDIDLDSATKIWLTIKRYQKDDDDASLVQVTDTEGLIYALGEAAEDATQAELTYDGSAETLTLEISEEITKELKPGEFCWDIQQQTAGGIETMRIGTGTVTVDITKSVV